MHRLAVAVLAALTVPAPARADCALIGLSPRVLGHPGATTIPRDGGIVVGAVATPRAALDKGDAAQPAGWTLRVAQRSVPLERDSLAPGLALYRLPATAADGAAAELEDAGHVVVAKVTATAARPDRLAAPRVRAFKYASEMTRRGGTAELRVDLDGDPPPAAVAIVIGDAKEKPRSWGAVPGEGGILYGYRLRGCEVTANGTVESKPGDRVTAWWIDDAGRRSPASKPIEVTK